MTAPTGDAAQAWSARHSGLDPAGIPFVPAYLRVVDVGARRLVRVPPNALTAAGVGFAVAAVLAVPVSPVAAIALIAGSVYCDAVDGAVASLSGQVSDAGALADRFADRLSDGAFATVLWRCGAPAPLALTAASAALALEAGRGGGTPVITVAERPTRVICTVLACASAAVTRERWPAVVCALTWVGSHVVAGVQLARSAGPSRRARRPGAGAANAR
jgi:CDP-diacylglycerol--glycerol-3-phosphate 3-phosphatidyltransferase